MKWCDVVGRILIKKRLGKNGMNKNMLYIRGYDISSSTSAINTILGREKKPVQRDRRKFRRFGDNQEIECYPMTEVPIKARIIDASLGGLRLKTRSMLRINTNLGLVLCIRGKAANFVVKVLWESKNEGNFEYGVKFSETYLYNNKQLIEYISTLVKI